MTAKKAPEGMVVAPSVPVPAKAKPAPVSPAQMPRSIADWFTKPGSAAPVNAQEENKSTYFKEAMGQVFSDDKLDLRSDVREDMILPLSVGRTVARRFGGSPLINHFLDDILRISISKNRGSRREMADIAKGLQPQESPTLDAEGALSRKLLGRRG